MVLVGRPQWVRVHFLQGACSRITLGSFSLQGRSTVKGTVLMVEVIDLLTPVAMLLVVAKAVLGSVGVMTLARGMDMAVTARGTEAVAI
ncbi:unnamed protein product [Prorocentrum cordatum]|uniref:Uncharacterized protein n=1 Tax=Prorocentrum cordatum TaxID=2364126 RepID=A0ABN9VP12_9DINO|nr:unnamed protein product [Polarella glacialis]